MSPWTLLRQDLELRLLVNEKGLGGDNLGHPCMGLVASRVELAVEGSMSKLARVTLPTTTSSYTRALGEAGGFGWCSSIVEREGDKRERGTKKMCWAFLSILTFPSKRIAIPLIFGRNTYFQESCYGGSN